MATRKKRTSLDALITPPAAGAASRSQTAPAKKSAEPRTGKGTAQDPVETPVAKDEIIRQTLYLPLPVFDQLRALFFEEQRGRTKRRRMHDYYLEGIDLLFKDRGLKSIEDLTGKK